MDDNEREARAVLTCPMGENDAGAGSVGEYLMKLTEMVWREDEGFSGKRPFGNSGWKYEVYGALTDSGLTAGGDDDDEADRLISAAVTWLGRHFTMGTMPNLDTITPYVAGPPPGRWTVGTLKTFLADYDDDMAVVLSRDAEGNGFSELDDGSLSAWDGEDKQVRPTNGAIDAPGSIYTEEDRAPEGSPEVVVLWPTN